MHGDSEAFGVLGARALPRLVGTAGLILRDADAADDAAQEALVRAWRDLPGLREPDRFDGWLHRILVRTCGDQFRDRSRQRRTAGPVPERSVIDATQSIVDRDEMDRALGRLGVEHRTVIVLRYYLGLSHPEIAEAIDRPIGTVKSRLSRGMAYLEAGLAADRRAGVTGEESA
jgi:RNA polymerase sigma-70 factor (ECF subfamily)